MAALKQNFSIFQGDDEVLVEFVVANAAGAAIDVSLASFEWGFARTAKGAPLVTKSTGSGSISLSDPVNGQIQITMREADTVSISGDFYHELVMTLGSKVETLSSGTMTVNDSLLK